MEEGTAGVVASEPGGGGGRDGDAGDGEKLMVVRAAPGWAGGEGEGGGLRGGAMVAAVGTRSIRGAAGDDRRRRGDPAGEGGDPTAGREIAAAASAS